MELLICISKTVLKIFNYLLSFHDQSGAFLHFSKAGYSDIYSSCLEAQSESWFPEWNLVFSVTCAYLFPYCMAAAEHCVLCYRGSYQHWAASIFPLLIALWWGEKGGMRQIIQRLTTTRGSNVPMNLSTYKSALNRILIFTGTPCFPSL